MNIPKIRIIVDDRERKSRIPELLKKIGADIEIKTLLIGDYVVGHETVIERKSIRDFLSSIFDGRLFDQCNKLKENFKSPVIILEGSIDDLETLVENPFVLYGAMSTIALDFKIPIIPTPSAAHTAKLLIALGKRKDVTKGPFLKKIKKSNSLQKQQLVSLSSLPGVGEKLAVRMLEKFGTPLDVLTATAVDLAKVEGLGALRARKIKKMLETKSKHLKKSDQKTLHD